MARSLPSRAMPVNRPWSQREDRPGGLSSLPHALSPGVCGFIVMIDEAMEKKPPITTERADVLVNEARVLLTGSNESGSFAEKYAAMMERVPSIATAHAEISKAFVAR